MGQQQKVMRTPPRRRCQYPAPVGRSFGPPTRIAFSYLVTPQSHLLATSQPPPADRARSRRKRDRAANRGKPWLTSNGVLAVQPS